MTALAALIAVLIVGLVIWHELGHPMPNWLRNRLGE